MIKYVNKRDIDYELIKDILKKSESINHMTNDGPAKRELDKKLHQLLNLPNNKKILSVNSGTSALHLIMRFLDLKYDKNLRWASIDFTFPSVMQSNKDIVIFDIDISDGYPINIKWDKFDVLLITNLFGSFVNIDKTIQECILKNKLVIFDNSSCPLSIYNNKNISEYGNLSFGSLHHTKILGFGEGGFIVCEEEEYDILNRLSNFGFDIDRNWISHGSNYKISDISSAFILQNIHNFNIDKYLDFQNKIIYTTKELDLEIFNYKPGTIYGNLPIIFKNPISHLQLRDLGIEANKYYKPLTGQKNSKWLYERIINLPISETFDDFELKTIKYILKQLS